MQPVNENDQIFSETRRDPLFIRGINAEIALRRRAREGEAADRNWISLGFRGIFAAGMLTLFGMVIGAAWVAVVLPVAIIAGLTLIVAGICRSLRRLCAAIPEPSMDTASIAASTVVDSSEGLTLTLTSDSTPDSSCAQSLSNDEEDNDSVISVLPQEAIDERGSPLSEDKYPTQTRSDESVGATISPLKNAVKKPDAGGNDDLQTHQRHMDHPTPSQI